MLYYLKAHTFWTLEKYPKAIEQADKALQINKKFLPALYIKGRALEDKGKPFEAIEMFDRCIKVDASFMMS